MRAISQKGFHSSNKIEKESKLMNSTYCSSDGEKLLNSSKIISTTASNTSLSSLEQNYLEFRTTYVNLFTKTNRNKRVQTDSTSKHYNKEIKGLTNKLDKVSLKHHSKSKKCQTTSSCDENADNNKQKTKIKFQKEVLTNAKSNSKQLNRINSTETIISIDVSSTNNNTNKFP